MVSHADFWHATLAPDQPNILMVTIGIANTFFQSEFSIHAKKFRTGQPPVVRGATSIGKGVRSVPSAAPPRVLKQRAGRLCTLYVFHNSPYWQLSPEGGDRPYRSCIAAVPQLYRSCIARLSQLSRSCIARPSQQYCSCLKKKLYGLPSTYSAGLLGLAAGGDNQKK